MFADTTIHQGTLWTVVLILVIIALIVWLVRNVIR